MNLKNMLPDAEFKLLSRKIRSHYTRAENKIDQFVTFKDTPSEALLYIEPVSHQSGAQVWRLYKKFTTERQKTVQATIKASPDLLYLMSWAALNHIYESGYSRLTVQSGYVHISQNLAQELMGAMAGFFSESRMKIRNRYIVQPVFHAMNFIILNFNLEDADAVRTVSYIYHTSWGESFIEQQPNPSFLVQVLERVLQAGIVRKKPFEEVVAFNIPNPRRCYRDIISMFRQAWNFLIEEAGEVPRRFVTRIGADYVVVTARAMSLRRGCIPVCSRLPRPLPFKPERHIEYSIFDNSDPVLVHLGHVVQRRVPNTVSIYTENGAVLSGLSAERKRKHFYQLQGREERRDVCGLSLLFLQKNLG
jgi:hypothetical protein